MRRSLFLLTCAAGIGFGHLAAAQTPRARAPRVYRTFALDMMDGDRAAIGLATAGGGSRDTLGALVTSITPGSPAEKAGIKEGDYVTALNGVNLRAAREDVGDEEMGAVSARRLVREMRKVKPGSEVELRLTRGGKARTVKVKTVAARDLPGRAPGMFGRDMESRPALGLGLGEQASRRDTLGVFVTHVTRDGPAEKAGIVEGDRIAAINGTNLRVAREDAGEDPMNVAARRFHRALRTVKPGDKVELRVYSNGQPKTVSVTAAKASDVFKDRPGFGFMMGDGDMDFTMPAPPPPMHVMPVPAPGHPPRPPGPSQWHEGEVIVAPSEPDAIEIAPELSRQIGEDVAREVRVEVQRAGDVLQRVRPQIQLLRRQFRGEIQI